MCDSRVDPAKQRRTPAKMKEGAGGRLDLVLVVGEDAGGRRSGRRRRHFSPHRHGRVARARYLFTSAAYNLRALIASRFVKIILSVLQLSGESYDRELGQEIKNGQASRKSEGHFVISY
jgi:hypothetical protein